MRRELDDVEKNIVKKALKKLREEIVHLEYLVEYNDLMVNKGLWQNYLEKVEEFKGIREELHGNMKMCWEKIGVLQEHLDKGVEIKEERKEEIPGIG